LQKLQEKQAKIYHRLAKQTIPDFSQLYITDSNSVPAFEIQLEYDNMNKLTELYMIEAREV
jgi:hypothetical protein